MTVLFRQVEKEPLRFHRGACLKERLHQIRPQRSESLEEKIGVLIFGIGGREMLDKFERSTLRGDAAMRVVLAQLNQARQLAIGQRRYIRVVFDLSANQVSTVREDTPVVTTTLATVPFEGGATFSLISGVPDTPDAFGMSGPTSFNSTNGTFASATNTTTVAKFAPDGTLVDWNGFMTNGTVFTSVASKATSARAVTVLGSTGRVRGYRWDGHQWNKV